MYFYNFKTDKDGQRSIKINPFTNPFMKISLILWKHHTNSDGTQTIKARIQDGKRTGYKSTNVSILPVQWKNGKIIKHPNAEILNKRLADLCDQIERTHGIVGGEQTDFYWWVDKRINMSKQKHGFYNVRKLESFKRKLQAFRERIAVSDITYAFLDRFETWLLTTKTNRKKPHHPNYISDCLFRLRIIVNDLVKAGVIEYHKNPFHNYPISMKRTNKERLGIEEIRKLESLKLKDAGIKTARDMYLLSFYCGGIRFGDLCRLKRSDIVDGWLEYKMNKTDKLRSIKLYEATSDIINRQPTLGNTYVFETNVKWETESKSINARNSFYNRKLKLACKKAGINQITFHTARNTVADILIKDDTPMRQVQEVLGHSKLSSTEIYAKSFYKEKTAEALGKLHKK